MGTGLALLIAGIVGSIITGVISSKNNEKNLKAQEDANAKNIEMQGDINDMNYNIWKGTQDYNSPGNQLRMLRNAGINPITAYGNVSSGSRSVPISLDSAKVQPVQSDVSGVVGSVSQLFGTMQSAMISNEQVEIMKQDVDAKKFENEMNQITKEQQILKAALDNGQIDASIGEKLNNIMVRKMEIYMKGQTLEGELMLQKANLKQIGVNIENEVLKGDLLGMQKTFNSIDLKFYEGMKVADFEKKVGEVQLLQKQLLKLEADIANSWKDYSLKDKQSLMISLGIDGMLIENEIKKNDAEIGEEELKIKKNEVISKALANKLEGLRYLLEINTYESAKGFVKWQSENEMLKPFIELTKAFSGSVGGKK